jgi:hypothetical protein
MLTRHEGGCVCGAVRYATSGDPIRVTVCHCTWCQRRTGTAFSVEAVFDENKVELNGGLLTGIVMSRTNRAVGLTLSSVLDAEPASGSLSSGGRGCASSMREPSTTRAG